MRNQLFIFSKNRASQLNLLITSIFKNAISMFDKIYIIYKADEGYIDGYNKLIEAYSIENYFTTNIVFHQENNFRHDLIRLIDDNYDFTTFLVDDVVIYNKIEKSKEDILKVIKDDVCCFSLRLGYNCVYSHPANLYYTIKENINNNGIVYVSHNKQIPGDFGYPLSTDGHIFKTTMIKNLLIETPFNNPNTLEANLQKHLPVVPPMMLFLEESKVVSIPVNLVNDTYKNRHGVEFYFSEKDLNDRFLNNEIIDFDAMDFTKINGPHKEIKYEFKKY